MIIGGIDVGWSLRRKTTGICATGSAFILTHVTSNEEDRKRSFQSIREFSMLGIDAPLLPPGTSESLMRSVEKVFYHAPFNVRCRPAYSHVPGTGREFRLAGVETVEQFTVWLNNREPVGPFPRVLKEKNLVEAFPNAFLGVLLGDDVFHSQPDLRRGSRFDWLYDQCNQLGILSGFQTPLQWEDQPFWGQMQTNSQHDERSALICALTAVCVLKGKYVAVGEPVGGYFFLPPWEMWKPWAKEGLEKNRLTRDLPNKVEVWIDGHVYSETTILP